MSENRQVVQGRSASCAQSPEFQVEIDTPYELSAVRVGDGRYATEDIRVERKLVVSLGDSFASGEGNPDYPAVFKEKFSKQPPESWAVDPGYPAAAIIRHSAEWLDATCHRSLLSWPSLYALRQAITQPHVVIQFASFACSGAEVLDGFIFPQRNPPGNIGIDITGPETKLKFSQQRALAQLLCSGQDLQRRSDEYVADSLGLYMDKYKDRYAKARVYGCDNPLRPDEVLVQFGGNDTGFSGVVKHVLHPQMIKYRGFFFGPFLSQFVSFALLEALQPVSPVEAQEYLGKLPEVYVWLKRGLSALELTPDKVRIRMLQYPDPGLSSVPASDRAAELRSCNARTRDANMPLQHLIAHKLNFLFFRHDGALFGATPERLDHVRAIFVPALQVAQEAAVTEHGWELMVSSGAFNGRGICAGSLECDTLGEHCPNADRVRWSYRPVSDKAVHSKSSPSWGQMSSFYAYSLERKRGMRYAIDALLAGARYDQSTKRIRLDWISGIAHPTAEMHARIARTLPVAGRP